LIGYAPNGKGNRELFQALCGDVHRVESNQHLDE
jgi:hypothetical protein